MLIGQRTELQSPFLRDGKRGPRRELHCAGPSSVRKLFREMAFMASPGTTYSIDG